jgi:hypothetical protein
MPVNGITTRVRNGSVTPPVPSLSMSVTLFCWKSGWSLKKISVFRVNVCRMNGLRRAYQRSAMRPASSAAWLFSP